MTKKIVSYDLRKAGQNYEELAKAIKSYGSWARVHQSVWAINTNQTCVQVRDFLASKIDANDTLYVGELTGSAAWTGLSKEVSDWFKENA